MRRNIKQIIAEAGGPKKIAAASRTTDSPITAKAVYDWPAIGIPERHWAIFIRLARATTDELHKANLRVRASRPRGSAVRAVA